MVECPGGDDVTARVVKNGFSIIALYRAAHKRKPGNMLIFFLEAWTAIFRVTQKLTEIKLTYLLTDLLTYIHSSHNYFGLQYCYTCVVRGVTHTHNPAYWLRITAKNIYRIETGPDIPRQN